MMLSNKHWLLIRSLELEKSMTYQHVFILVCSQDNFLVNEFKTRLVFLNQYVSVLT